MNMISSNTHVITSDPRSNLAVGPDIQEIVGTAQIFDEMAEMSCEKPLERVSTDNKKIREKYSETIQNIVNIYNRSKISEGELTFVPRGLPNTGNYLNVNGNAMVEQRTESFLGPAPASISLPPNQLLPYYLKDGNALVYRRTRILIGQVTATPAAVRKTEFGDLVNMIDSQQALFTSHPKDIGLTLPSLPSYAAETAIARLVLGDISRYGGESIAGFDVELALRTVQYYLPKLMNFNINHTKYYNTIDLADMAVENQILFSAEDQVPAATNCFVSYVGVHQLVRAQTDSSFMLTDTAQRIRTAYNTSRTIVIRSSLLTGAQIQILILMATLPNTRRTFTIGANPNEYKFNLYIDSLRWRFTYPGRILFVDVDAPIVSDNNWTLPPQFAGVMNDHVFHAASDHVYVNADAVYQIWPDRADRYNIARWDDNPNQIQKMLDTFEKMMPKAFSIAKQLIKYNVFGSTGMGKDTMTDDCPVAFTWFAGVDGIIRYIRDADLHADYRQAVFPRAQANTFDWVYGDNRDGSLTPANENFNQIPSFEVPRWQLLGQLVDVMYSHNTLQTHPISKWTEFIQQAHHLTYMNLLYFQKLTWATQMTSYLQQYEIGSDSVIFSPAIIGPLQQEFVQTAKSLFSKLDDHYSACDPSGTLFTTRFFIQSNLSPIVRYSDQENVEVRQFCHQASPIDGTPASIPRALQTPEIFNTHTKYVYDDYFGAKFELMQPVQWYDESDEIFNNRVDGLTQYGGPQELVFELPNRTTLFRVYPGMPLRVLYSPDFQVPRVETVYYSQTIPSKVMNEWTITVGVGATRTVRPMYHKVRISNVMAPVGDLSLTAGAAMSFYRMGSPLFMLSSLDICPISTKLLRRVPNTVNLSYTFSSHNFTNAVEYPKQTLINNKASKLALLAKLKNSSTTIPKTTTIVADPNTNQTAAEAEQMIENHAGLNPANAGF
nr:MAG: hypothetical protein [Crogonang virus 12]